MLALALAHLWSAYSFKNYCFAQLIVLKQSPPYTNCPDCQTFIMFQATWSTHTLEFKELEPVNVRVLPAKHQDML